MKLPKQLPTFRLTSSNVANVVGVLIAVYLVVVLGQTIKRNYDLGQQISSLKAQLVLLKDQNEQLSYNIQYYKTDSFRDHEARSQLGLQLPGENVVIIPNDTPAPSPQANPQKATASKSNLQQWFDLLGGSS